MSMNENDFDDRPFVFENEISSNGFESEENIKNETSKWPWDSSKLQSFLQSPINIQSSTAKKLEGDALNIQICQSSKLEYCLKTEEHGVRIELSEKADVFKLCGAFMEDTYEIENIHFHWGEYNDLGSEHFIDGESFAAETHLVTYKKEYGCFDAAIKKEDGVIVLAFFIKVGQSNTKFDKLVSLIPKLNRTNGVKITGTELLFWFMPQLCKSNQTYYTYPGSLTDTPYTEIVTFILLPGPVEVSEDQLQMFRYVTNLKEEKVVSNRREIQPLKDRPILIGCEIVWTIENEKK